MFSEVIQGSLCQLRNLLANYFTRITNMLDRVAVSRVAIVDNDLVELVDAMRVTIRAAQTAGHSAR